MNSFEQIAHFNEHIGNKRGDLTPLTPEQISDRYTFIIEELEELTGAITLTDQVDALLDVIVFAVGGLHIAGLTPEQMQECLTAVFAANMVKTAGIKTGRNVNGNDAVKPDDWVGPEVIIESILQPSILEESK